MELLALIKKASELSSKYKVHISIESSLGKKDVNEIWLTVYRNGWMHRRLLNAMLLESSFWEDPETFLEKEVYKFLHKVRKYRKIVKEDKDGRNGVK